MNLMEADEGRIINTLIAKGTGTECFDIAACGKVKRPVAKR